MTAKLLKDLTDTRDRLLIAWVERQPEPDRSKLMAAWSQARQQLDLCNANSNGYTCCCLKGHEGEHLAMGRIGTIFERWTA